MAKPNYFLVSVSTRQHLDLCLRYALAGFTNSIAGVWTFVEIREGDFVSFLYGARAFNLYQVVAKEAIRRFVGMPPWPPVSFRQSGRSYHFPFRLHLRPVRKFCESLVRREFAYVAENLLLRAGYRKTHFQADQTTLQNVSQMGELWNDVGKRLVMRPYCTFEPQFTLAGTHEDIPFVFHLHETILQAAIRQYLSGVANLTRFLSMAGFNGLSASALEALGEKALSQGHVDILLKDRVPIAQARKIAVEVKLGTAQPSHLKQLRGYMEELGDECIGGVLIAKEFSKTIVRQAAGLKIGLVRYGLNLDNSRHYTFDEILSKLQFYSV
ncbi:hypothetical protein HRbin23_00050 [bacterium HR23]|nr:hypothetical protein HRbin23_00050 [bacterium HR23]